MKFAPVLLVASLASAASVLPTYTSTVVSSVCSASSCSSKYYGNSTITSSEEDQVIYETDVATNQHTLTLVSTSCSADGCVTTTVLESLSTVVTTIDGVLTTYVTGVPITTKVASTPAETSAEPVETTDADETVTHASTTLVTITSCSDNKCHETAVTTGLTEVTEVVDGSTTVYTTYCPLSEEPKETTTTKPVTTVITVTSCSDHKCTTKPVTTGLTEVTSVVNDETTVYTTYCPLTIEPATEPAKTTEIHSTVITVTSCSDNKCSVASKTTGVAVLTSTVDGTETLYTTYCPLTTEPAPEPTTVTKPTPADTTVNVITNNIVTQSKATSTVATFSSYEGGAARAVPLALALPVLYMLL